MRQPATFPPPRHGRLSRRRLLAGMAFGLVSGVPGVSGCGGSDDPHSGESQGAATLTNTSDEHLTLALSVNGKPLVQTDAELVREVGSGVLASPGLTTERAFALALWRFVVANRRHTDPLTGQTWAHAPVVFFNAVGFGYCDDAAAVYTALARAAGFPARVWALEGHVVPEIRVDGRWELFDPDLEVYYLNDAGLPAGVEELAADPWLIVEPRLASVPVWARELQQRSLAAVKGEPRYSQEVADIYGSVQDNRVAPAYDDPPYPQPAGMPLQLPPRAAATIGRLRQPWLHTMYDMPLEAQGALRLALPAGTKARLTLPLLPLRISGAGVVAVNDFTAEVGSGSLDARLADFESPITSIEVLRADDDLQIEYLLNDTRFGLSAVRSAEVGSSGASAVSIEYLPSLLA
jgi:hypothetical protein